MGQVREEPCDGHLSCGAGSCRGVRPPSPSHSRPWPSTPEGQTVFLDFILCGSCCGISSSWIWSDSQRDSLASKAVWMATQGRTGNPGHGTVTPSSGSASIKTGKSRCLLSQGFGERGWRRGSFRSLHSCCWAKICSHLCYWLAFLCLAEWEPCQPLGNHHPACPVQAAPEAESYPHQPAQGQSREGSYRSSSCVISCSRSLLPVVVAHSPPPRPHRSPVSVSLHQSASSGLSPRRPCTVAAALAFVSDWAGAEGCQLPRARLPTLRSQLHVPVVQSLAHPAIHSIWHCSWQCSVPNTAPEHLVLSKELSMGQVPGHLQSAFANLCHLSPWPMSSSLH